MKKRILFFIGVFAFNFLGNSQSKSDLKTETPLSPSCGHNAETILKGAVTKGKYSSTKVNAPATTYPASSILNCNKFAIYFDDIAGGFLGGFADPVLGPVRRNTLCNVLTYIQSRMDFSNVNPANPIRINVLQSYYPGFPAPAATDWLGIGTPGYFNTGVAGIRKGFAFDYMKTGIDPIIPNDFHATLVINFDVVFGQPINWQDDDTAPFMNCNYDLFTVMLHELTHTLGWFSLTNMVGSTPASIIGSNQYSGIDYLIQKGSCLTSVGTTAFNKLILGTTTAPTMNPLISTNPLALQQRDLWINSLRAPWNYPVYSGSQPGNGHVYDINKAISHLDEQSWAFSARQRISPGYQQDYVMAPETPRGRIRREYSKGEIQTLVALGYTLTPSYVAAYPFVVPNRTPYNALLLQTDNYQDDFYPDTAVSNFFLTNDIGSNLTINLTLGGLPYQSWWYDPDGDQMYVYPNSLYNIRGCGNGGNNHNCLSISGSNQQIVFTPRPGFFGRAQFAFNLYDGKEKGGLVIMTIDVGKGTNTVPVPGTNLVMNGDFEEGTEVKRLGAEEIIPNTVYEYDRTREGMFRYGTIFGDCQVYNHANINGYFPSNPIPHFPSVVNNSQISCNGSLYTGSIYSPFFSGAATAAHGQRYYNLFVSDYHNFTLKNDLVAGKAYTLEYDYFYSGGPVGVIPFDINFTSLGLIATVPYGTIPVPKNFQINTTFNSGTSSWTHVTRSFTYCGVPSDIVNFSSSTYQTGLFIDNLSITQNTLQPPSSLSVVDNVGGQSCFGRSVLMTAAGGNPFCGASATYSWLPIYLTGTSVVVSPTATTVYTIVAGTNVITTHTIFINNPIVTVAPLSPLINCTSPVGSITLTASGASSYTWTPGNIIGSSAVFSPIINTVYTVTGKDVNNCLSTKTVNVVYDNTACVCTSCNLTGVNTVLAGGTLSSAVYCINNSVTFTGTTTLSGDFKIGSGVVITIAPTAHLILNNAHFYGCTNMWQGFIVKNGGKLSIANSLVEDAITAVDILNNTQTATVLNVSTSTFNRNKTGISIENYTQNSAAPFLILNSLFTCRNIPTSALTFPLPAVIAAAATNPQAPLSNAWINNSVYLQTGTSSLLKPPFSTAKSSVGLKLKNVGRTLNPAVFAPVYYEFVLGSVSSKNIFDNQTTCISLENSNFTSYNTIYQNTTITGGNGISAIADRYNHNRLRVLPVSGTVNRFVDCGTAIDATDYFVYDINTSDIRSTQLSPAHPAWQTSGINITTSRYKTMNVSDNTFYNVTHNLNVLLRAGSFVIPAVSSSYGQYTGIITVNRNTFRPHLPANTVTYQKVGCAINMQMYLGSGTQTYEDMSTHLTQVDKNNITDALVGVNFSTWQNHNVSVNTNIITLADNSYQTYYPNYGIGMTANNSIGWTPVMVANNIVSGYGLSNPKVHGIYIGANDYFDVNCNDVSNVTNGLVFDFFNNNLQVYNNTMTNNMYGFMLDNNALIGIQGLPSNPQDNMWQGAWNPPMYMTALFNNSDATLNKLFIRGAGMVPYDPDGSSLSTTPPAFVTEYSIANNNLLVSGGAPPPNPCPMFASTARMSNSGIPVNRDNGRLLEYVAMHRSSEALSPEVDFIQKGQVYRSLKQNASLLQNSADLSSFKSQARNSNYETFYKIEQYLSQGNFSDAGSLTDRLITENKIDKNYQAFYKLAVKNGLSQLASEDSVALRTIAELCPYTEGLVVFDARVLLNARYKVNILGINCENKGLSLTDNGTVLVSAKDIQLFPNPAMNTVNVKCAQLIEGKANVIITDVNGRKVFEKNLTVTASSLQFQVDLKNGMYILKLQQPESGTVSIKKLIIQK